MIVTPEIYGAWGNLTLSDKERISVEIVCGQVDRSIKNRLKRTLEKGSYSVVLDAPRTRTISLCRWAPIDPTTLEVYLNFQANGNPSAFTSDSLLTQYEDYILENKGESDTDPFGYCLLTYLKGFWGVGYYRPPYSIAVKRVDVIGAVKCTFDGGFEIIPEDIVEAACITISKVLGVRRYGMQVGSESWNGYSYNLPGVGMMINGLLGNPDIRGLLEPYVNYASVIG